MNAEVDTEDCVVLGIVRIPGRAAVIASIYTTVPALLVGVGLHLLFGPLFGFGVLGG